MAQKTQVIVQSATSRYCTLVVHIRGTKGEVYSDGAFLGLTLMEHVFYSDGACVLYEVVLPLCCYISCVENFNGSGTIFAYVRRLFFIELPSQNFKTRLIWLCYPLQPSCAILAQLWHRILSREPPLSKSTLPVHFL